jgi:hypothetical protein
MGATPACLGFRHLIEKRLDARHALLPTTLRFAGAAGGVLSTRIVLLVVPQLPAVSSALIATVCLPSATAFVSAVHPLLRPGHGTGSV